MTDKLIAYTDIKSPYAYLAVEPARRMARKAGVVIDWLPYTLDIPDYLGDAELGPDGNVVRENRSPHQWRRVKYSYMDVRRYANLRGLTIRGHPKIRDSSIAAMALLWARERGQADQMLDAFFAPFWKHELDIESPESVARTLDAAGIDADGFLDWQDGEGRIIHDSLREETESRGVFGVPWFIWKDEMFWGREALPLIGMRITGETPDWAADLGLAPDDPAG